MTYEKYPDPFETRKLIVWLAALATSFFILLFCSACTTTRYVKVPEVHHDTLMLNHEQHESIWLHDSIYYSEMVKGDTVYRKLERWHTRYRDRLVRDYAYDSRRDSVPVPYPVVKRVPAQLSWHQQARIWIGNIVLVALAVCAAVWLFRKRKWILLHVIHKI